MPHLLLAQRLERQSRIGAPPAAPGWPAIQQLRSAGSNDEERGPRPGLHHVLDQIEQALAGPMQILEDDNTRSLTGQRLQERPPRGEDHLALRGALRLDAE